MLCFPNAGNAEDMYTNEGTGPRRAVSPLLVRLPVAPVLARIAILAYFRPVLDSALLKHMCPSSASKIASAAFNSQEWCRASGGECLAVQPPGRGMRSKEPCITAPQALARQLLPVVASRLAAVPYVVSGSSSNSRAE